jgi:alginate O-acetyltransferase complex protein AlgI
MLFPTFDFAIFFAIASTVDWLTNPYPVAWKLSMLGMSYVFYGWHGRRGPSCSGGHCTVLNYLRGLLHIDLP